MGWEGGEEREKGDRVGKGEGGREGTVTKNPLTQHSTNVFDQGTLLSTNAVNTCRILPAACSEQNSGNTEIVER